jgi:hypothetical protein
MAVRACPFDLLDEDAIGSVLDHVRRDRLGNETIPGHVCEATSWRLLGKRYLATSIRHPSEFNGTITFDSDFDFTVDQFHGGRRYTRILTTEQSSVDDDEMQLHIVRHPPTGQIFAITSGPSDHNALTDHKYLMYVIPLAELARKLSGHNAEFSERLNLFDKIAVFGQTHRVSKTEADSSSRQTIKAAWHDEDAIYYPNRRTAPETIAIDFNVETTPGRNTMGPTIRLTGWWTALIPPQLDDVQPGETLTVVRTEEDAKRKSISALSIGLGYYDSARIAECGGWLVSLWRDKLAAPALLDSPTRHDPAQGLRHRGELAIAQATKERREAMEKFKRALVAYEDPSAASTSEDRRQRSIVLHNGPSAAIVNDPRKCATQTAKSIKNNVKDINQTHSSGRKHAITQPWDSREDEATTGLVDAQYANPLDPESSSDDEDEEDLTYVPDASDALPSDVLPPNVLPMDRIQRAILMRQMVVIDSDEDDDEDDEVRRDIAQDL